MSTDVRAIVFDIQRFSIHDGPGIRTVVFFKGCGLACVWCQNPEAIGGRPELAYYEDYCLPACAACADVCEESAIRDDRVRRVDFDRCNACGACVDACPSNALRLVGREMTTDEVFAQIARDRCFYDASGGGVTFSGGEPVLQMPFLRALLPRLGSAGIHAAIETCGCYRFEMIEPLLAHLDLVLFDVKIADPERHTEFTGRDNAVIHANLERLVSSGARVSVRMPVVPGINTDGENVSMTAALLLRLGVKELTLLPYNHLWEAKLHRLGSDRKPLAITPRGSGYYAAVASAFARHGVNAHAA